ncbi:MAG TPA: type IV pilus assembly protein PilM [Candidatus Binatia bacterium]|nr:type IV pilus assembly protein PilM [Candidatus Binatia bacterium]
MFESLIGGGGKGLIGLDISSSSVKVLELSRKGDQFHVEAFGSAALPPGAVNEKNIIDPGVVGEAIASAVDRSGSTTKQVAVAVAGAAVFTKVIEAPANLSSRELEEHVQTEAQNHIPYPLEEVNIDFQVMGPQEKNPEALDLLLAACRKEQIEQRQAALELAGLKARVVDIEMYAMENACQFLRYQMPDEGVNKTIAVIDIGSVTTGVTVLHNLATVYTRDQSFGGKQLTEDVMRHFGMSYEEAQKNLKNGALPDNYETDVLANFVGDMGQQIDRALQFFFSASTQFTQIDQILLAGGCAHIPNLDARIQEKLNIPAAVARPFAHMSIAARARPQALAKEEASLLVAAGLATRAFD